MHTESTACLHDTVSCQQGYLGLLTCLGLFSTHRSHCLCTPLLHTTSSLHTWTAHNTTRSDFTQLSCPLLVKSPSLAQYRHAGALGDDIQPVSFQIDGIPNSVQHSLPLCEGFSHVRKRLLVCLRIPHSPLLPGCFQILFRLICQYAFVAFPTVRLGVLGRA